jgi:hypothetical protein
MGGVQVDVTATTAYGYGVHELVAEIGAPVSRLPSFGENADDVPRRTTKKRDASAVLAGSCANFPGFGNGQRITSGTESRTSKSVLV